MGGFIRASEENAGGMQGGRTDVVPLLEERGGVLFSGHKIRLA